MQKPNRFKLLTIFVFIGLFFGCGGQKPAPEVETFSSSGTITAIDAGKKEISIDHEEIPGLMSAMEMNFPVKDERFLNDFKTGDRIMFELQKSGDTSILTKITISENTPGANGKAIFLENCAKCHGQNGEGAEKGISFLKGHAVGHPEEDFIKQVNFGEEGEMPAFRDKLTADEIAAVVKYVRNVIQKDVRKENSTHKH